MHIICALSVHFCLLLRKCFLNVFLDNVFRMFMSSGLLVELLL